LPAARWIAAAVKTLIGAGLLWLVVPTISADAWLRRGWVGMIGIIMMLGAMEAARRTTNWVILALGVAAILYALYCNYLPGLLHGMAFDFRHVIGYFLLYEDGMFGIIMAVISTMVVAFNQFYREFAVSALSCLSFHFFILRIQKITHACIPFR
jgi:TRAP-type uncharacterized transport system fused permease subunit